MNTRILHRRLGLIFSVFVFLAAGSGILHNIMSMTQKAPPKAGPTAAMDPARFLISPQQASRVLPLGTKLAALTIREIGGEPWYQLYPANGDPAVYVSAVSGIRDDAADEQYASEIASSNLGGAQVKKTDYLTTFNSEYISIFRILPVYRFDTGDGKGRRVYVSTMTGSVTRATDDAKQFEANVFGIFHKFAFIPNKTIRNVLLTMSTTGIALVALLGIFLFLRTSKKS